MLEATATIGAIVTRAERRPANHPPIPFHHRLLPSSLSSPFLPILYSYQSRCAEIPSFQQIYSRINQFCSDYKSTQISIDGRAIAEILVMRGLELLAGGIRPMGGAYMVPEMCPVRRLVFLLSWHSFFEPQDVCV